MLFYIQYTPVYSLIVWLTFTRFFFFVSVRVNFLSCKFVSFFNLLLFFLFVLLLFFSLCHFFLLTAKSFLFCIYCRPIKYKLWWRKKEKYMKANGELGVNHLKYENWKLKETKWILFELWYKMRISLETTWYLHRSFQLKFFWFVKRSTYIGWWAGGIN